MEPYSREEVFDKIFKSFNYGNLGMFIGAGFSKAVVGNDKALGWLDIIEQASDSFGLDFPEDGNLIGVSLPELASKVCKQLADNGKKTYAEAKTEFKKEISKISSWLPDETQTIEYRQILELLNPSWIITTNYDLVLENLLTGKCKSLSPDDYLSAPRGIIPIYHFHGTRLDPETIIITQDDYIPLFRPNEYRQSKLALTIRESTTLILGYGLGDTNVLSAVDWSKNIYTADNEYPYDIIQVLWVEQPKEEAYRDENGNIIIETKDVHEFLNEVITSLVKRQRVFDEQINNLKSLTAELKSNNDDMINKFTNNSKYRLELLEILSQFEYYMISSYIDFLKICINQTWSKTNNYGNFSAYDTYLCMILDIVINYDYKLMPPELFQVTAHALNSVLAYVNNTSSVLYVGTSFDATRTWHRRKKELSQVMVTQLEIYAKTNNLHYLTRFITPLIIRDELAVEV